MNIKSMAAVAILAAGVGVLAQCGSSNEIGLVDGGAGPGPVDATISIDLLPGSGDALIIGVDAEPGQPIDAAIPIIDAGPGPSADAAAADAVSLPRPAACGGTVQSTASSPWFGSFNPRYISAFLTDCPLRVTIVMAESTVVGGKSVTITLLPNAATGSFAGHSAQIAIVDDGTSRHDENGYSGNPPVNVGTDVEISAFPDRGNWFAHTASGLVTGTFSIQTNSVSMTGTFSTPLCDGAICI